MLFFKVFQGTTDGFVFKEYIKQLLHHCGRWPELNSVLIMDNASFHYSDRITEMCRDTGVKVIYLPLYSPDLNLIKEFFAELKAFIKKQWRKFKEIPYADFKEYLEWCVGVVGSWKRSTKGHFRYARIDVKEY